MAEVTPRMPETAEQLDRINDVSTNFTLYRCLAGSIRDKNWEEDVKKLKTIQFSEPKNISAPNDTTFVNSHNIDDGENVIDISIKVTGIETRDFTISDLSKLLSDRFMEQLICSHFHIITSSDSYIKINGRIFTIPNAVIEGKLGISGIEATIFRNGYIALVIRAVPKDPIDPQDLLNLVKRPDKIAKLSGEYSLNKLVKESVSDAITGGSGLLSTAIYWVARELDESIGELLEKSTLSFYDYEHLTGRDGPVWVKWAEFERRNEAAQNRGNSQRFRQEATNPLSTWRQWSRPYVGVYFSRPEPTEGSGAHKSLLRFIISSGRTTPEFLGSFRNPHQYLSAGNRNVYGDGGSIVFVASRGWCVWDNNTQGRLSFQIGVIEMTHFVIMAVEAGLRARRRFNQYLVTEGGGLIRNLNAALAATPQIATKDTLRKNLSATDSKTPRKIWKKISGYRNQFTDIENGIYQTTRFFGIAYTSSIFDDGIAILESHLKTHTARATISRYKHLRFFDHTDRKIMDLLKFYDDSISHSSRLFGIINTKRQRFNLLVSVIGLLLTIGFFLINKFR